MIFRIKENMTPALMLHIMRLKFIHSSSNGSKKTHYQLLLGQYTKSLLSIGNRLHTKLITTR